MKSSRRFIAITLAVFVGASSIMAYTMIDSIGELGPGANGKKSAHQMVSLWNKLSDAKMGPKAKKFLKFLGRAVRNFNWDDLYSSKFLAGRRGKFRTVTFRGINHPGSYKVTLTKAGYATVPMTALGNIGTEYGFKENKKSIVGDTSYSGYIRIRAALKQFSHINGTAFLTGLQKIIDPDNLAKLNAPSSRIYSNMGGLSRKLINEYAKTLPNWSRRLGRLTGLRSLVKVKTHKGQKYTHLKMIMSLNMKNIKKDYPDIEDWLDDIGGMIKFKFFANNSKGHRVVALSLDSKRRLFTWSLYTRGGKLIPMNYKRKPLFKEEFSLSEIKKYTFYNIFNAKVKIWGIRIYTGNIIVRGQYRRTSKMGKFYLHFTKIPSPKITGRAFGIFPTWMMDMAIPGNIEELAGKFTKVMEKGNNGRGTRLAANWNTRRPTNTIFSMKASSEFIDNFFINFALRIWSRKFNPDEDTNDQISKLYKTLTGAMLKDMIRLNS